LAKYNRKLCIAARSFQPLQPTLADWSILLSKKPAENPSGTSIEVFDGFRQAVIANRAQFMKDLAKIYFGANLPGANISEALVESCWGQQMLSGFPAAYFQIKAFSETDMTEDLKK
jgi:non-heme chloroperoxidase